MKKTAFSRRGFLKVGGAAFATATLVPRHVVARSGEIAPSEKINIAGIGVGGMGGSDVHAVAETSNIFALCDVDEKHAAHMFKAFPNAKRYTDFRKMLDESDKQIDAVVVGTPDHDHAVTSIAAMKRGKHVYCEKPLAHSIFECREMARVAKEKNVVTQMGNQGHSFDTSRVFCEWIQDGAIGKVHTIDCGCAAINSGLDRLASLKIPTETPKTLDWDLWLGPASQRPYNPAYLPGSWRGWTPFGNGTIGDWACHVIDPIFWALDLGAPKTIRAEVKDWDFKTQGDAFPKGDKIIFEFAAKGDRGPVTVNWHSGTVKIPRPKVLESDRKTVDTGAVVYGDKGAIMYGSHGAGGVRIIPEVQMKAYKLPEKTIPRAKEHHQDWLDAIRQGKKAGSDFSYGASLSEIAMLGVIAIKMTGIELQWDGAAMKFTNCDEANRFIDPKCRAGWEV